MITDKNRIYDGWFSLEGGVDAGRTPTLLDPNMAAAAENMVFRGGHPRPRPGFRKIVEFFTNPLHSYDADGNDSPTTVPDQTATQRYKIDTFQGAVGFSPHNGEDSIVALIGGRLYQIIPGIDSAQVTELVLPYRNDSRRSIAYMIQADKWMVAQDGQSQAILYDGKTVRRALSDTNDPDKTEVPAGTLMAYGMGRIVLIVNDRDVAFGDLFGSHEGEDPADSLILFTERNFLTGGFDAAIPFQQGVATGMSFFPQLDTSTGNGQLMVFTERGASAFLLSLPRDQWQTSPFQIKALETTGLRGHRTISAVNEDLWFRAEDGYRSYRQARSEATGWAHIPLSTGVRQFLEIDNQRLLKYASAIYFDNRIIGTCNPYWNNGRVYHTGLVTVDFDIISAFGTKFNPAWDGHWQLYKSDVQFTQVLTGSFQGVTRAFAFGIDVNGENQLYEFSKVDKNDFDGPIDWILDSRAFDFSKISREGNPFTENEIYDADVWLRDLVE